MREVIVPDALWERIAELRDYLVHELKLSERAADARVSRLGVFLMSLGRPADYALCRFRRWREAGYRCVPFEGWVFAYEAFEDGVILRDMAHGAALHDGD